MPRKGILIRLAIYLPVIAFLAYGAFCNRDDDGRGSAEKTSGASDGKKFQVIEVSPAEAERMLGRPLPSAAEDGKPEAAPAPKGDPAEASAPASPSP